MSDGLWAIVLAGGEGSRLRALARDHAGRPAPKQFCPLGGERPPLARALERAQALVQRRRVMVSVVEAHRPWWSEQLADLSRESIVSQPFSRGTATGVLLPLLHILERDPHARVIVLPADHAVEDEAILSQVMRRAVWIAERRPEEVILLGMTPTWADVELGWVLPAPDGDTDSQRIAAFYEKPRAELADRLMASGAMWNAFLLAARAAALVQLYRWHLPELLGPASTLRLDRRGAVSGAAFAPLPARDFSRDLLTPAARRLRVVRVPPCGWTDLGTPERLEEWLAARSVGLAAGGARPA